MSRQVPMDAFQGVPEELLKLAGRLYRLASGSDQPYRLPMEVADLTIPATKDHATRYVVTHIANRLGDLALLLTDVSTIPDESLEELVFASDEAAGAYRFLRDVLTEGLGDSAAVEHDEGQEGRISI